MDPNLLRTINDAAIVIEALQGRIREMEQGMQQQMQQQQEAEMTAQTQQQQPPAQQKTASDDSQHYSFSRVSSDMNKNAEQSNAIDNFNAAWAELSVELGIN